jgi:hypothetical protein
MGAHEHGAVTIVSPSLRALGNPLQGGANATRVRLLATLRGSGAKPGLPNSEEAAGLPNSGGALKLRPQRDGKGRMQRSTDIFHTRPALVLLVVRVAAVADCPMALL